MAMTSADTGSVSPSSSKIEYKCGTADVDDIAEHLNICSKGFIPPLEKTVGIKAYAAKIAAKAVTFEAWADGRLVALVAAYFNTGEKGFITNVSTMPEFAGRGLASELVTRSLEHARANAFKVIGLEVNAANERAIGVYRSLGFVESNRKGDSLELTISV